MTKLHYVGFNGYQQCPKNNTDLPKVIADWTSIHDSEILNVCCTHRTVVVETEQFFKLYGVLDIDSKQSPQIVEKPEDVDSFAGCDNFLIASKSTKLWKLHYNILNWEESKISFINKDDSIWKEKENKIVKFSFLQTDVIILLSNGSVWKLNENDEVIMLFPYDLDKAIDICTGLEHCLILTESGCVLSFGNGSRGQLGNGDLNSSDRPIQNSDLGGLKIVKIAAGGWHSCALTDSGDLCTWGWNNYGQLSAFDDENEELGLSTFPIFVEVGGDTEVKVTDVACGSRHTIAKLEKGDLFSTGWNLYRQLGTNTVAEKVSKFTRCNIQKSETGKLITGPWYTVLLEKLR